MSHQGLLNSSHSQRKIYTSVRKFFKDIKYFVGVITRFFGRVVMETGNALLYTMPAWRHKLGSSPFWNSSKRRVVVFTLQLTKKPSYLLRHVFYRYPPLILRKWKWKWAVGNGRKRDATNMKVFLEFLEIQPQNILGIFLLDASFQLCLILKRFCSRNEPRPYS